MDNNNRNKPTGTGLVAHWPLDEGSGRTAMDVVSGQADEISYALLDARFTEAIDPGWRFGMNGGSLLFDGYSTWITRKAGASPRLGEAFTVSAWVAPRSYEWGAEQRLSAIVNQHDREAREGFIFGIYRHGSWSLQLGLGGEWHELWCHDRPLAKQKWSHVAATFDKDQAGMKLFLNGEQVAELATPANTAMTPCASDLLIGKNNQAAVLAEAFRHNMFDGLMDEVRIYDRALSTAEIAAYYEAELLPHEGDIPAIAEADIRLDRAPLLKDRHRPQYHASPPVHWMNEPHAPIYFNGKYHLFYQHNPQGPYWAQIHWGHWVSEDMVHWRDLPIALAPEKGAVDPDGAWSGSAAYDENGIPALFFTAGDDSASPNQRVGLARSSFLEDGDSDLVRWKKHQEPLIVQEKGQGMFGDFRDPFVWKEGELWYLLIGSGTDGQGGTALAYTSGNMIDWEYKGPFYVADPDAYPYLGNMWELPVLLPLGKDGAGEEKHVFLISPLGPGADVEVFYWIGAFDCDAFRFVPDHDEPQLIDVGDFHFTGPSGMVDPRTGRNIVFTIAQGERTPQLDYDSGWAHNAGLPVQLLLREDGRLGVEPIEELKSLRGELLCSLRDKTLAEANGLLANVQGDMLEIQVEFAAGAEAGTGTVTDTSRMGLKVRRSPASEEETFLYYDPHSSEFGVDRLKATSAPEERIGGVQSGKLELRGEALRLRVYLDRSMVEAYANGLKSLTTRVYPGRLDALGLQLYGDEDQRIKSLDIWEMKSIYW
ncbi:GH32 C-terminal domain-containing protein [Paenibacillus alkaliterrae]|uniref:GH32 C-terminal domain-containing protein n=1 Tax=Paenibacillus alkaliterrae TaxID=320909 RepID=UPI001F34753E|nr:GH32 C-terminal domain-containing protein [Paenibacillus alkaliterrae]MCF2939696.1 GH32 C-terminal domain-containing protein [Paenibacillus alkaliterrae]